MLSRVADSIYWMSRYVERAENIARFIDVNLRLALDLPPGTGEQWEPLVLITADLPLGGLITMRTVMAMRPWRRSAPLARELRGTVKERRPGLRCERRRRPTST